jgi:cobalamin biosynthesis protein CobC
MALEHGGNISAASQRFNVPVQNWVDLSTGISPWSWPVPSLPEHVWQTLPYADEDLENAAAAAYGCPRNAVLAVPGSQYALQYMPSLLSVGTVAMPLRGYAEHRAAWTAAGHAIVDYRDAAALHKLVTTGAVDYALVINPNNPTGELWSAPQLQELHLVLAETGGYLVVDEAFIDACPQPSVASLCPAPGLIVYRSLGKFYGLAGIRLGFLLAPASLCGQLAAGMPPWLVSHPARWIGAAALGDRDWQAQQSERLAHASAQWTHTLREMLPRLSFNGTVLFTSGCGDAAYCEAFYQAMGRRAVLLRLFEAIDGRRIVRFGLPLPQAREHIVRLIRESTEEIA